jgi:hypothetical protein
MASRPFSAIYVGDGTRRLFLLPAAPLGAVTVTVAGTAAAFTRPDRDHVEITTAPAAGTRVVLAGQTGDADKGLPSNQITDATETGRAVLTAADKAAGRSAIGAAAATGSTLATLTNSTGGTSSNTLGATSLVSSLTDGSGGTSGVNAIGAVSDVPSAANAIATLVAKQNTMVSQHFAIRNSVTSVADKLNQIIAILKGAGLTV